MAADNRTIKELSASGLDNVAPLCIQYTAAAQGKTEEFELRSSLLHHIPKYHGLSMEDPNKHLKEFEVVCSSMTPINVDGSILKMKAFPFSLLEKVRDWLYELAPGIVTSWESMKRAFLEKFFPTSRVILLRKRISGIQQDEGESFPTYYECFKSLVASCPQHQMKEELLLQYFYEGLLPIERQILDASVGGALVDKTPTAARTLIANQVLNAQQYEGVGQRSTQRQHQVNEGQKGGRVGEVSRADCGVHGAIPRARFMQSKKEEAKKDILETFRKVQVNIPLLDAIKQVPRYAKFFKELCTTRKRILTNEVVKVGENVSAILQRILPPKFKDPGSFTIPCVIGNTWFESAMLDLGASINVMPYSIYASMNLGELKNDGMIIQLADTSNAYPRGVLEDVLVQDHFDKLNDDALQLVIARGMDMQNIEAATIHTHGMHELSLAVPLSDDVIEMVAALESLPP
ncbi:unnamed protein product [Malus baccata var. baccata]